MIYSMTGFASGALELDTGSLSLELRSVNHRYLDTPVPDAGRIARAGIRIARSHLRAT